MERLLARLQARSPDDWILKGGVALELRLREAARATIDMDLGIELEVASLAVPVGEGIREKLQEDASGSGDDLFEFVFPGASDLEIDRVNAHRFQAVASLAGRVFDRFQLDVAPDEPGSIPTEEVMGSGLLSFAEIPVERFRVVSRARHFAEKIHAYTTPHEQRTRVKDLLDLLLLEGHGLPPAAEIREQLVVVFGMRARHRMPARPPDPPPEWRGPFEAEAPRTGLGPMTLDAATARLHRLWTGIASEED